MTDISRAVSELLDKHRALSAENEALREALRPLVEAYKHHAADAPEWLDHDTVKAFIRIGELRAAVAALAKAKGQSDGKL